MALSPSKIPADAGDIIAVYCDGGVITVNPSAIGGTWAWCAVDVTGVRRYWGSGVMPGFCTNNMSEYEAAVQALEALPYGWSGRLYSDSDITLGRLFRGWACNGIATSTVQRAEVALTLLGRVTGVLLGGHPYTADLRRGYRIRPGKRDLPVSEHNVWCDQECLRAGQDYLRGVR